MARNSFDAFDEFVPLEVEESAATLRDATACWRFPTTEVAGRGSGVPIVERCRSAHVADGEGEGKLVRMRQAFRDREEALEAAGLSE